MKVRFAAVPVLVIVFVWCGMAWGAEDIAPTKAEDVVAKHLEALGPSAARSAVKTRVIQGKARYKIQVGGAGMLDGTTTMASEGQKFVFVMKFPNNIYRGEQIVTNGERVRVAGVTAQQTRSELGEFLRVQDAIVKEGLLGGELSTAWAFLHLDENKAKLKFSDLQFVEGTKLYDIRYQSKKNSDLDIHVYFDPETFRHVRTVYKLTIHPQLGHVDGQPGGVVMPHPIESSETATARQNETRYRIDETISNFRTVDGLMLPLQYVLKFTVERGDGQTQLNEWDLTEDQVSHNVALDAKNFEVK